MPKDFKRFSPVQFRLLTIVMRRLFLKMWMCKSFPASALSIGLKWLSSEPSIKEKDQTAIEQKSAEAV